MIIYILDAMFSGQLRIVLYPLYIVGYIVLVLISVAFAFGFYWRFLEAGAQTTQAAGASVFEVERALQTGQSRLRAFAKHLHNAQHHLIAKGGDRTRERWDLPE